SDLVDRARDIIKEKFGVDQITFDDRKDGFISMFVAARWLSFLFKLNKIIDPKHIQIPAIIRRSKKNVIEKFIEAFHAACSVLGSNVVGGSRSFKVANKLLAEQLVVVLRSIGIASVLQ